MDTPTLSRERKTRGFGHGQIPTPFIETRKLRWEDNFGESQFVDQTNLLQTPLSGNGPFHGLQSPEIFSPVQEHGQGI